MLFREVWAFGDSLSSAFENFCGFTALSKVGGKKEALVERILWSPTLVGDCRSFKVRRCLFRYAGSGTIRSEDGWFERMPRSIRMANWNAKSFASRSSNLRRITVPDKPLTSDLPSQVTVWRTLSAVMALQP